MFAKLKRIGLALPRTNVGVCQRHRLGELEVHPRPASVAQPVSGTHINAGMVE